MEHCDLIYCYSRFLSILNYLASLANLKIFPEALDFHRFYKSNRKFFKVLSHILQTIYCTFIEDFDYKFNSLN